ncbi:xanthine dehydrogenase family protein molybdopterin-binding subunit [Evansella cellulosilytica]|uniref:Aldehyde oxidase and xanthine dehydrogenase molybdopterin binding protein n=1 Tax=Evansella cellulosilytica (strain ATCC 21833 / DSM 2522 / FERM P-1141 / JCM 9156 / N-4) TaxID=649639 RepID=E6U0X7_EVAC2|nr:xanthine dehydrogenase family protein molybdopterin-binding subunit [Evansella cellulosilytica]ADU30289.1 aldehyde oxidase and xanthine dehydrogenase molybdopterin binding protein [Evansella cellulosilytica DSM 2522]
MSFIGRSVIRKEASEKITGKAMYTDDYHAGDKKTLHARLVISTVAHAKIKKISTEESWKVKGVRAIICQEKLPLTGEEIRDRPPIAHEKVRYHGEVIAIVVAEEPVQAMKAASLIKVDYESLPVVNSPSEAIKKDAPIIHEELDKYDKDEGIEPVPNTNIANKVKIRKGDISVGLESADTIVDANFTFSPSDHTAMEPRSAIAEIKPFGEVYISTSSQAPFMVKKLISSYFDIEVGKIIVDTPLVGGGYGGKASVFLEILAYIASKAVGGKKVKIVHTREEDMITSPCHVGLDATIKLGATKDGKLTAAEIIYLFDSGAYSDKAVHITRAGAVDCTGPYRIDNVYCDSYTVYTNHPFPAPYRGFGHTEVLFAFERAMDMLADKLNIDPFTFRYINAIKPGDTTPTQTLLNRSNVGNLHKCMERVRELSNWEEGQIVRMNDRFSRVKGLSCVWKNSTIPPDSSSGVILTFNEDGSINIISGVIEIGTGTKTVLAQMLAEHMQMDINQIHVKMEVDTQSTPEHWKTVASRGTFMAGRALIEAADDVISQLKDIASTVLRRRADDLVVANQRVFLKDNPSVCLSFDEIAYGYVYPNGNSIGGQIIGRGKYILQGLTYLDEETGAGKPGPEWAVGAQVVEVEFDHRDLTYRVLKVTNVLDVGKVLNYKAAMGQVTGAASMGLAFAGRESFIFNEKGIVMNPQLRTYRPIHYSERPEYVVDFIETPHIEAPFGARGVGEQGLLGMPAALSNCLSSAINAPVNHLPLTPELLWRVKGANK